MTGTHRIGTLLRVLDVKSSSYYDWLARLSPDTQSDSVFDTFAGFKVIRCGG